MKLSGEMHRQTVKYYFDTPSETAIILTHQEYEIIHTLLQQFYKELGNFNWIKMAFLSSLDAYWKKKGLANEVAIQYEGLIGSHMQRFIAARQFYRNPSDVIKTYIVENTINVTKYWHNYYDPYPPLNIEKMDEPYRSFFLLLNDLIDQMDAKENPRDAVTFLASMMAAFALTYPTRYLAEDPYFKGYVKDEVKGDLIDDDYTYYLCKMMDYALLDRY